MHWHIFKDAANKWLEDRAPRMGAALAYYSIFSMAPLIVIAIGVAGLVLGREAAQGRIAAQVDDLIGGQGAEALNTMVKSASDTGSGGVGTVLGIIMLIVGATGLFAELQDALNNIWRVQAKPNRGVWGVIRDRFLSFSMVMGVAFLLLVSLIVSAALAAMIELLGAVDKGVMGHIINIAVSVLVLTALFAMIFRYLPDARVAWRDVWLGAFITTILFVAGKTFIGLYLGHSGVASAYGAAGSLAVLLVWLYYSAQIFLYGAEVTSVIAMRSGRGVTPTAHAEKVPACAAEGRPQSDRPTHGGATPGGAWSPGQGQESPKR
jgi:membrane protein